MWYLWNYGFESKYQSVLEQDTQPSLGTVTAAQSPQGGSHIVTSGIKEKINNSIKDKVINKCKMSTKQNKKINYIRIIRILFLSTRDLVNDILIHNNNIIINYCSSGTK